MTERKLATVDIIRELAPIPGADAIERATVRGWHVVVKKGEFNVGDPCIYIEVDSNLPLNNPHFEFLAAKANGKERFRVRTSKFRGQISQGIVFPLEITGLLEYVVGHDVTDLLNIEKYEPEIPACLAGDVKGPFPGFISKTDEERIQNLVDVLPQFRGTTFYVTEKLDGTSATFYYRKGEFGVCSRNWELREAEGNTFWQVARKLDLERILSTDGEFALQGEIIGPGIQKNRLQRKAHELYVFKVIDLLTCKPLSAAQTVDFCTKHGLTMVPVLEHVVLQDQTVDDFVAYATRNSVLTPQVKSEGFVFRTAVHEPYFSFKALNPEYLLKHGE
jgi:RNA ligase (TIGR02306 family)